MKIFLISPVRGINETYLDGIQAQVDGLEAAGHEVYWPARDTNQNDPTGLAICDQNFMAMKEADTVKIIWDGKSTGCLFDLGMAFALGKPIVPVIGYFPPMSKNKSFQNMVYELQEKTFFI